MIQEARLALTFLTTLPVGTVGADGFRGDRLAAAGRWFPAVGLLLGILLAFTNYGASLLFADTIRGVLVIGVWVLITGGLHLDGFTDCCDGLLAPVPTERRLEIMHDPRLGTFGVTGLILLLLLKGATVAALHEATPVLLLAPVWARWLLLVVAHQPTAQSTGMGASFAAGLSRSIVNQGLIVPLFVLILTGLDLRALAAILLAGLLCVGSIFLARVRLGGMTGDVYGLVVEVSEVAILLVYALK